MTHELKFKTGNNWPKKMKSVTKVVIPDNFDYR